MNEKISEQISAMFDDELDEQEQELLLRRLKQDADLQSSWSRYQIIGDVMRHSLNPASHPDLLQDIRHEIEHEPAIQSASKSTAGGLKMMKPIAGMAIAASVAAMAIIGLQNMGQGESPYNGVPRLAQTQPATAIQRVSGTRWNMQQPDTEMRLNGYLVNHSEYTSGINLKGMINYARIAGYDSRQER
jgi:sigma-E factor negative regulatory protein RseA